MGVAVLRHKQGPGAMSLVLCVPTTCVTGGLTWSGMGGGLGWEEMLPQGSDILLKPEG